MNCVERMFLATPWNTENELLIQLAQYAFDNNLVRSGDRYYDFSPQELNSMAATSLSDNKWTYKKSGVLVGRYFKKFEGACWFHEGWVFLDEDGPSGCIRLFSKCSNDGTRSKYSFWKDEEGQIQINNA